MRIIFKIKALPNDIDIIQPLSSGASFPFQQIKEKTKLLYEQGKITYSELETSQIQLFEKELYLEQLKIEGIFLKLLLL